MPDDLDRLNEIFNAHENAGKPVPEEAPAEPAVRDDGPDQNTRRFTGHVEKPADRDERDFKPIRQRRDGKTGVLGALMYFVFVVSLSVIIACVGWMAATDVLALNKDDITAEITIPDSIFTEREVDVKDEDGKVTGTTTIHIADMDYVADVLKEAGIIEYKPLFKLFCSISNAEKKIDPGVYQLSTDFDYRALVKKMQAGSGAAVTVQLTFPEGYTMEQIFDWLEENGVCKKADLYDAAANSAYNYSFLEGVEAGDASRLEGYLFPDTYEFYVGMQASSAINKFLQNFHAKITADMYNQAENLNLSLGKVVTIASMIESEAANNDERATIASVIYNRLASGMPLQIDATVQYALEERKEVLTEADLKVESPYNTYLHTGLPPTPISNPGLASIKAALQPADTNYYFYALDTATGTHRFFATYEEQQAFVATQDYGSN